MLTSRLIPPVLAALVLSVTANAATGAVPAPLIHDEELAVATSSYDANALVALPSSEITGSFDASVNSTSAPTPKTEIKTGALPAPKTEAAARSNVTVSAQEPIVPTTPLSSVGTPVRLSIPSASISAPIQGVGVNDKGEMAVPSGDTNNVGWYQYGTRPGGPGTAVMDAHVFAAFKNLEDVRTGTDVYVKTADDETLHFIVTRVALFKLSELTSSMLFTGGGESGLNLITCAGTFVRSMGTYDHRLIVYAKFVGAV